MKNSLKLIGIGSLIYILYVLDYLKLWEATKQINPQYLLLSCLLYLVTLAIRSYRWELLILSQSGSMGFLRCFFLRIYVGFVANITPGRVGEFFKLKYLREIGFSRTKGITNLIMDRMSDLVMMLGLSLVFAMVHFSYVPSPIVILSIIVFWLMGYFVVKKSYAKFLSLLGETLKILFDDFVYEFKKVNIAYFLTSIVFTMLGIISTQFQIYLIALGLNLQIEFLIFFEAILVANLIALIPISVSGLGTREFVLISLLAKEGIPAESAALISLIDLVLIAYIFNGLMALGVKIFKKQLLPTII